MLQSVNVYGVFNDYFNIYRANRTCDWTYPAIYGNVCHCKRLKRLELLMNKKIIILAVALSLIPAVSQARGVRVSSARTSTFKMPHDSIVWSKQNLKRIKHSF